jgi:hypothetical protein
MTGGEAKGRLGRVGRYIFYLNTSLISNFLSSVERREVSHQNDPNITAQGFLVFVVLR